VQRARIPPTRPALPPQLDPPPRHTRAVSPSHAAAKEAWFDLDEPADGGRPDNAAMALDHTLTYDPARLARVRARRRRDLAPAIGLVWSAGLGGALWALLISAWWLG
jgi:hypothetical protein